VLQFSDRVQGACRSTIISSPNSQEVKCNSTFCRLNEELHFRNKQSCKRQGNTVKEVQSTDHEMIPDWGVWRGAGDLFLGATGSSATTHWLKKSGNSSVVWWPRALCVCFQNG
jgi:hypothetical protein